MKGDSVVKLSATRRRKQIVQIIMEKGHIEVRELADQFQVTTETIRKDLLELDKQNIVKKGHGDATISSTYQENTFNMKVHSHEDMKQRIARKAVALVPEEGVVMIDSGTTAMQVAKLLNLRTGLTIITNSLSAAQILANTKNQLLVIGGELRIKSQSFVGSWTSSILANVFADISFIGCDGFNENGPSIRSYRELQIKQLLLSQAQKSVLICDSSKMRLRGLYTFAEYSAFDCLITDDGLSQDSAKVFTNKINVLTA